MTTVIDERERYYSTAHAVTLFVGRFGGCSLLDAEELSELVGLHRSGVSDATVTLFVRQLVLRRLLAEDRRQRRRVLKGT